MFVEKVNANDKIMGDVSAYYGTAGLDPDGGSGGCNPLYSNRRGSIILYNFIRKEKISNAINNCYQVNPLFQKSWIRACTVVKFRGCYSPIETVTENDPRATTAWPVADMMFYCTGSSLRPSCSWSARLITVIADPVSTCSCVGMSFIAPNTRITVGVLAVRDSSLLSLACCSGVILEQAYCCRQVFVHTACT